MTDDHDLLTQVEGIGTDRANELLATVGSGQEVARRASSNWGAIEKVDGISEELARTLFDRMMHAGVFEDLRWGGDDAE